MKTMIGVHLTHHGGLEALDYRIDLPVPEPAADQALIRVLAAGVNNTDINTRIGWYSKSVTGDTNAGAAEGFDEPVDEDASWSGEPLALPRIQGADIAGIVQAVGSQVDPGLIGRRVLVATMQPDPAYPDDPFRTWTCGSECDGGFAQYSVQRADQVFPVDCDWSDVELASIPCAYSTAEGMLTRAQVGAETVLITGASGGVGSAAIQLAKRRGARVIAQCGADKRDAVLAVGADQVIERGQHPSQVLGQETVDVVVDLVAGPQWPDLLDVLKRGGRYVASGAIAGPIVELDVRTLYLKDLTLIGSTAQPRQVFENLVGYIERGEIRPLVARTYPLADIRQAQQDFMAKAFTGKLVLIPPGD